MTLEKSDMTPEISDIDPRQIGHFGKKRKKLGIGGRKSKVGEACKIALEKSCFREDLGLENGLKRDLILAQKKAVFIAIFEG